MANDLTGNPLRCDTAGTIINKSIAEPFSIQYMQWIDDPVSTLTNADTLVMTVNGVNVSVYCASVWPIVWEVSFAVPTAVYSLIVTTIDGGALLIWKG